MRNMGFMRTADQVRAGTQTVTYRMGWGWLRPGDILNACVKCQGLKPGERVEVIREIEITEVCGSWLRDVTPQDVVSAGFQDMTSDEFVKHFHKTNRGCTPLTTVIRIEFEYID